MNKKLFLYTTAGFLFVSIIGTLSHFFYEWSGNQFLVGFISPVNESTWEHMKLFFFPMLLYAPFFFCGLRHDFPCVFSAICAGILIGTLSIPVLFYTYSGILGFNITFVDIAIFYLSTLLAFYFVFRLTTSCRLDRYKVPLFFCVCFLFFCFLLFTVLPPPIALFDSPVS